MIALVAAAVCAVIAALLGWIKAVKPRVNRVSRDWTAARDSIVGRDAVHDSITGRELSPALPGIGQRVSSLEEVTTIISGALARLADTNERLNSHDRRIRRLEEAAIERITARTESTEAWRAMGAAVAAEPPEKED